MLASNYTILWPAANSTIELVAIKWPYPSWNLFTSNSSKKRNRLLVYFSFHERYVVVLCSNFQRPETWYVWTGKLLFTNHCALSEQYWYMLSLLRLHKDFFFKNLSGPDNRFSFLIGKLRALNRLSFLLYGPRSGFFFRVPIVAKGNKEFRPQKNEFFTGFSGNLWSRSSCLFAFSVTHFVSVFYLSLPTLTYDTCRTEGVEEMSLPLTRRKVQWIVKGVLMTSRLSYWFPEQINGGQVSAFGFEVFAEVNHFFFPISLHSCYHVGESDQLHDSTQIGAL